MATTTPNFGWAVPTSSDLVKNGATAIETLGDAIDASMVDLKGGTTGQVLSKASNTDMDFTWAAAGGSGSSQVAGKNAIINGDFLINQRNFTSNTADSSFNFDRWLQNNFGGTYTLTPQTFTPGTAPIATYEGRKYLQAITASQSAAGHLAFVTQRIEDCTRYAGATVTVSFFAKADTGTPKIGVELFRNYGTGGSPSSAESINQSSITLTTSWARYSVTFAVPSISGKTLGTTANTSYLELNLWQSAGANYNARSSTIGIQNFTLSLWGVQVEYGSSATYFTTATGTLQGELAACQRYYFRQEAGSNYSSLASMGAAGSTTAAYIPMKLPSTMRIKPATLDYSAIAIDDLVSSYSTGTWALSANTTTNAAFVVYTHGSAALTQYRPYQISANNNSAAYIGVSAEL